MLIERGEVASKELPKWVESQSEETALLQGLWMHQAFNKRNLELLSRLLQAKNANVRSAAVRVLSDWSRGDSDVDKKIEQADVLKLFERSIADENPRVRLEAGAWAWPAGIVRRCEVSFACPRPTDGQLPGLRIVADSSMSQLAI